MSGPKSVEPLYALKVLQNFKCLDAYWNMTANYSSSYQ